jgi:hypothetical protein
VSCSYGTFLEHPISARVGKWLPPNRGATSTRRKICARGYGDLLFRGSPCRISRFELPRCLAAERPRKVDVLGQIAPHGHQTRHLPAVLHSLGGNLEAERVRKVHDQAHDSVVHYVFPQTVDRRFVDLQAIYRMFVHVVQRGVTAAEVVEGYSYSERPLISEHTN